MTEDERLNAVAEGHTAGTYFRIAETIGLSWRELRACTLAGLAARVRAHAVLGPKGTGSSGG